MEEEAGKGERKGMEKGLYIDLWIVTVRARVEYSYENCR
jgi:hypothetical protein